MACAYIFPKLVLEVRFHHERIVRLDDPGHAETLQSRLQLQFSWQRHRFTYPECQVL